MELFNQRLIFIDVEQHIAYLILSIGMNNI